MEVSKKLTFTIVIFFFFFVFRIFFFFFFFFYYQWNDFREIYWRTEFFPLSERR